MKRYQTRRLVGMAILAAIIIVLQSIASGIRIGPFSVTLSLIPMIIGAILYGPVAGAALGGVFGIIVVLSVVTGADAGGALMFAQHPIFTILLCLVKSTAAGFLSGIVVDMYARRDMLKGIVFAAIAAPLCNTGVFVVGILLFFRTLIASWAGGTNLLVYIITGLIGFNFIFEMIMNIVLVPIILRIIQILRRMV